MSTEWRIVLLCCIWCVLNLLHLTHDIKTQQLCIFFRIIYKTQNQRQNGYLLDHHLFVTRMTFSLFSPLDGSYAWLLQIYKSSKPKYDRLRNQGACVHQRLEVHTDTRSLPWQPRPPVRRCTNNSVHLRFYLHQTITCKYTRSCCL